MRDSTIHLLIELTDPDKTMPLFLPLDRAMIERVMEQIAFNRNTRKRGDIRSIGFDSPIVPIASTRVFCASPGEVYGLLPSDDSLVRRVVSLMKSCKEYSRPLGWQLDGFAQLPEDLATPAADETFDVALQMTPGAGMVTFEANIAGREMLNPMSIASLLAARFWVEDEAEYSNIMRDMIEEAPDIALRLLDGLEMPLHGTTYSLRVSDVLVPDDALVQAMIQHKNHEIRQRGRLMVAQLPRAGKPQQGRAV